MIKITEETVTGFDGLVAANKAGTSESIVTRIKDENPILLNELILIAAVSEPGFLAGAFYSYLIIKRQYENNDLCETNT
jgi:hypothetical protein